VHVHRDRTGKLVVSIPQSGLQAFRHHDLLRRPLQLALFQSLNRAYKRSDMPSKSATKTLILFQSLNRAYKRSDPWSQPISVTSRVVSIPQSGLQAFRLHHPLYIKLVLLVSIPQSGLQAFRRSIVCGQVLPGFCFNPSIGLTSVPTVTLVNWGTTVGCFNPSIGLTSVPTDIIAVLASKRMQSFNPSIGLTSVPTRFCFIHIEAIEVFQSLNRAYKRSDRAVPRVA